MIDFAKQIHSHFTNGVDTPVARSIEGLVNRGVGGHVLSRGE